VFVEIWGDFETDAPRMRPMKTEKLEAGSVQHNFLPEQYERSAQPHINHNYLKQQFADYQEVFKRLENLLEVGDFTLGRAVDEFEQKFASITGTRYAIGVGSGTDALMLSLKALGIDKGDEVITTPYTFFATIGAIVTAGARPVFVDVRDDYNIDPEAIRKAVTKRTKAILPVHWAGLVADMDPIQEIADKHGLAIVEDACHAITATYKGRPAGSFGATGCFSMHPLKNLNVWGDGGVIVTNRADLHEKLVLLRNHGLLNRDYCAVWAYNSRLDTLQAIVANHTMEKKLPNIGESRIRNAAYLDQALSHIQQVKIPPRHREQRHVYHLYGIRAENRDALLQYLVAAGIDAKVHYPVPMHLQPASKEFGYKEGDFPMAEEICRSTISLPVHEFINEEQLGYMVEKIEAFYK
jgi:dTDP-4-amino-4,6-dideoxygalactose transaminase